MGQQSVQLQGAAVCDTVGYRGENRARIQEKGQMSEENLTTRKVFEGDGFQIQSAHCWQLTELSQVVLILFLVRFDEKVVVK